MKVIDVLKLSSYKVDIYHKGQYINRFEDYKDLDNIEDWLLNSEVRDFDTDTNDYGVGYLEIDSK